MKKLFVLALAAFSVAACDAGIASSTTIQTPGSGSGAAPAARPVSSGHGSGAKSDGDCGECLSAAAKSECSGGSCDAPSMDCEEPCEDKKGCCPTEKKGDCSSSKECAPAKTGN